MAIPLLEHTLEKPANEKIGKMINEIKKDLANFS
jgi:hypothetical protein